MSNSFATPCAVACQTPLSMGFARQEYWGGLPFPSPGDFLDLGIEPCFLHCTRASPVAQSVKNLPAVQEAWVQSLAWKDPLEKEMAAHNSILCWKISWTEESGGLQSMGLQRVGRN